MIVTYNPIVQVEDKAETGESRDKVERVDLNLIEITQLSSIVLEASIAFGSCIWDKTSDVLDDFR